MRVFYLLSLLFASVLCAEVGYPSLQLIHEYQEWPTGIAVSASGRLFTAFPRQKEKQPYTVTETLGTSKDQAYPNTEYQSGSLNNPSGWFIDAQSVVIDGLDRLWVLDTGLPFQNGSKAKKPVPGGPKIMSFDLRTNKLIRTYVMPPEALVEKSSINDVRFNVSQGRAGFAYISDTAEEGAIIVVDLQSGATVRRLSNSTFTRPDAKFVGSYRGVPFYKREKGKKFAHLTNGANAIALSNGKVYFSPQASNRFHCVSQDVLADFSKNDAEIAVRVELATRSPSYSTGAESDSLGRVYYGAPEQDAINFINTTSSEVQVFVRSPLLKWPDSFSQGLDGYLYATSNDLPGWPQFNNGKELRKPPFHLYKIWNGAKPAGK